MARSRLGSLVQAELTFHRKAWAKAHGASVTAESGYIMLSETLTGEDVLGGLAVEVREIF